MTATPSRARLERSAIADWVELTQVSPWLETGGIILGERATAAGDIVIHHLVGPGPKAKRRFRSFEPDTAYTQIELERAWFASGGAITYLGDWHTHPWGPLRPSQPDLEAMRLIAETPSFQTPYPLSLITRPAPFTRGVSREALQLFVLSDDHGQLNPLPCTFPGS